MTCSLRRRQRGAALIVGLIMLVLVTLMLVTALRLGMTNFKVVSNQQFREEATAAASKAIDQVISSDFTETPEAEQILVDIDDNGVNDYLVDIATPVCIAASQAFGTDPSSLSLPPSMTVASTWNTVWELDATVSSASYNVGAAAMRIRSGVRVLLTQSEKDAVCN